MVIHCIVRHFKNSRFRSIISCLAFRRVHLVFVWLVHALRNAGPFIKKYLLMSILVFFFTSFAFERTNTIYVVLQSPGFKMSRGY